MTVDRISSYNLVQSTLINVGKAQAELANQQIQLSSGFKSQDFAGISGQAVQYLQLQDKLARTDNYISNNTLIKPRLDTTSTILDQVINTATSLQNIISQHIGDTEDTGGGAVFDTQLHNLWQTLISQLNTTLEGRYLFSGSATSTPAVDANNFPTLLDPDTPTPDDGYYLGNQNDLTVRASDSVQFTYNVRADAPGFQKIFAGLAMAQLGDSLPGDAGDAKMAIAEDLVQAGLKEVITIRAQVHANSVALNNINSDLGAQTAYFNGVRDNLVNTDLVSVSTQVAVNQGILQASFQAFARITSLQLSNFLR